VTRRAFERLQILLPLKIRDAFRNHVVVILFRFSEKRTPQISCRVWDIRQVDGRQPLKEHVLFKNIPLPNRLFIGCHIASVSCVGWHHPCVASVLYSMWDDWKHIGERNAIWRQYPVRDFWLNWTYSESTGNRHSDVNTDGIVKAMQEFLNVSRRQQGATPLVKMSSLIWASMRKCLYFSLDLSPQSLLYVWVSDWRFAASLLSVLGVVLVFLFQL